MNKNDLIESLAEEFELTKSYARELVDRVFEKITEAAHNGEEVGLFGFGKFKVVERQARKGAIPGPVRLSRSPPRRCSSSKPPGP